MTILQAVADMPKQAKKPPQKTPLHILIIGGGITGLLLAQGLRKLNITRRSQGLPPKYTCTIFERDPVVLHRGGGFSLTIHWALEEVYELLTDELSAQLYDCCGNPTAMRNGEMGLFTYLNLRTGDPLLKVSPPAGWKGARVSRAKFVKLLLTDLDVRYDKRLSEISFPNDDDVCAKFEDGTKATGQLLVGADGARSTVRQFLYGPENTKTSQLPVRMINCRCEYPLEQLESCLKIDPHLFHGGDPIQNGYFMFVLLDLPTPTSPKSTAAVQLLFTWPYEHGTLGEPKDLPTERRDCEEWIQRLAEHWANPVGDLVRQMPKDSIIRPLRIEEWFPDRDSKRKPERRVTLIGDAAHLTTAFRGENANHGVVDAAELVQVLAESSTDKTNLRDAVARYETSMLKRSGPAVVKSRDACIDANHYASVKPGSAFLSKKARTYDDEEDIGLKRR